MSDIYRDLIESCQARAPTGPGSEHNPLLDREIWTIYDEMGLKFAAFADEFSDRLSRMYIEGHISYEAGDRAMNALQNYSLMGPPGDVLNGFAAGIYDAFDAGEYHHAGDSVGDDLSEKHTRPAVRQLLDARHGPNKSFKPMPLRGTA
jgi:hypothetical protein